MLMSKTYVFIPSRGPSSCFPPSHSFPLADMQISNLPLPLIFFESLIVCDLRPLYKPSPS